LMSKPKVWGVESNCWWGLFQSYTPSLQSVYVYHESFSRE
jgi:hypothetical protein